MSLFGWKEREQLEIAQSVIDRDKRVQKQYDDVKKVHHLEKLVAALIATILFGFLIYFFA